MAISDYSKSDINRLLTALSHGEPDRVPHLENWVTSKPVYEYVLRRKLDYDVADARVGGVLVAPEDYVEFACRLGMDAVLCNLSWRPNNVFRAAEDGTEHYVDGTVKSRADLENLEPPVPIGEQFDYMERYIKACEGTGVGIVANFTSFFDSAMLAAGVNDSFLMFYDDRPFLEKLMDILLEHQVTVMREMCERYGDNIAYFMINDDIGHNNGLMINPDMFNEIFPHRMKRLIAPAKELGKLVLMHTDGKMDNIMPILHEAGSMRFILSNRNRTTYSRSKSSGRGRWPLLEISLQYFLHTVQKMKSRNGCVNTVSGWRQEEDGCWVLQRA